jgi:fermentation-respiration switch protein FrsA (DUF1100 family)
MPVFWSCRIEERFIFFPVQEVAHTPHDAGLGFQDIWFPAADGTRLNGWFVPHPQARATLLWFHGNAGNISHRVENIRMLREKVPAHVFIFDYRGYGRSEGAASEEGTYSDAAGALGYLRSRSDVDPRRIVLFGRSLGAAVAGDLAAREDCLALILETPFVSVQEMAKIALPFLPIGRLLRTRYDLVNKVGKVRAPILVLHGDQDEIVPYAQGKKVFEAAPEPKEFYTIRGARHNDTYLIGGDPYFQKLKNFIDRAEGRGREG